MIRGNRKCCSKTCELAVPPSELSPYAHSNTITHKNISFLASFLNETKAYTYRVFSRYTLIKKNETISQCHLACDQCRPTV